MRRDEYPNQIEKNHRFRDLYKKDYKKRLLFARDNGCNTVMLTGNGEPLLNRNFLEMFGEWNDNLPNPFRWIEIKTSGTLLDDEYLRFLRNTVGVNTISLSLSALSTNANANINRTHEKFIVDIQKVCSEIKRYDFNLRLSLNMTSYFNRFSPKEIFDYTKNQLSADQLTFRVLYQSGMDTEEDRWIQSNRCSEEKIREITEYVKSNGRALEVLPFGSIKYSVNGMGVVIDTDCMSTEAKDTIRYLILRPNAKLYSKWDDKGSLVF